MSMFGDKLFFYYCEKTDAEKKRINLLCWIPTGIIYETWFLNGFFFFL